MFSLSFIYMNGFCKCGFIICVFEWNLWICSKLFINMNRICECFSLHYLFIWMDSVNFFIFNFYMLDSQPQVIKLTNCLPMVGCSLQVPRLLPPLKLVAMRVEILLKVALNTKYCLFICVSLLFCNGQWWSFVAYTKYRTYILTCFCYYYISSSKLFSPCPFYSYSNRTVLMMIYNNNRSRSKYRFCIWYMQQNFTIARCKITAKRI
jgi:hypothetical protein